MQKSLKHSHLSKSQRTRRRERIFSFVILFVICAIWVFPFIYMFGMSFKTPVEIGLYPTNIFPTFGNWTGEYYEGFVAMKGDRIDDLPIWMMNSLTITTLTVFLTIIVDSLASYAFVFFNFKGKKMIFTMIILSMTIPGVIGTTPLFSMYASLSNTFNAGDSKIFTYMWLILPAITSVFNLFLMKNFFDSIPKDIVDSARSDGASDLRIFWSIIMPLAKSTILLCGLFAFVGSWNDFFWPSLILSGKDSTFNTITLALSWYAQGDQWEAKGKAMATAVFALIPIFIVFSFTQNKMIDGLATTGVKN